MSTTRMVACSGWRYHKHGDPYKVLKMEKYRVPFDRSGSDVVVKMLAAPVHRHDKNVICGYLSKLKSMSLPAVGGVEGVGVVEEVGRSAVYAMKEGDLVWVNNATVGTWASHVVTGSENLDVLPNRADTEIEYLSSMSLYLTAHNLADNFVRIQPNDVVLQTGASSAVSQLSAAILRARGAKVIQTLQLGRGNFGDLIHHFKTIGAFAIVPYFYLRSNYMRRLIADLPPPKLLLNHSCGQYGSHLVKLLGDNGTVVTYGVMSHKPMQVANMDIIQRGITFKGFSLPHWIASNSRETRMRMHQNIIDSMTVMHGQARFRAQRFKMDTDAPFAFSNAWDSLLTSRKPILRMVGEYGEWRRPTLDHAASSMTRAVWDDLYNQLWESAGASDQPLSMKYYTPMNDMFKTFFPADQSKEMGLREVFFRRPNTPRNNTAEVKR